MRDKKKLIISSSLEKKQIILQNCENSEFEYLNELLKIPHVNKFNLSIIEDDFFTPTEKEMSLNCMLCALNHLIMNIKTTYQNKLTGVTSIIIHGDNPFNDSVTICQNDYAGDDDGTIFYSSVKTNENINCADCIAFIEFCKSISKKKISKKIVKIADVYD
ncbi:MAG: hypothetical protein JXR68_14300 [Bacteroidales bacterium]|nr:hypothetical protein [Bacteroidales bacterium]